MVKYVSLFSILLAIACGSSTQTVTKSLASYPPPCSDVTVFGAIPDDGSPDDGAFQSAVDACASSGGGVVDVPTGRFTIARQTWDYYGVKLKNGVILRGQSRFGTILEQVPGVDPAVRMFYTYDCVDCGLTNLTLDGQRFLQSSDTQRHGIFANGSTRLRLSHLTIHDFSGDGIYLYTDANDTSIDDVWSYNNGRNGATLGSSLHGVMTTNSTFSGNLAQQFDTEPGGTTVIHDVTWLNDVFDLAGASSDYALTIGGNGSVTRGYNFTVQNCRILGSVWIVWADKVQVLGNTIVSPSTKPAVSIYRSGSGFVVSNNDISLTNATTTSEAAVRVLATTGSQPDDVIIDNNVIRIAYSGNFGIDLRGPLRAVIMGNTLIGAGAVAGYSGIRTRATVPMRSVSIIANVIRNFGSGVTFVIDTSLNYQMVMGNLFDNGTTVTLTP